MTEMIDTWKELIETRAQTTSWDLSKTVDVETIKELSQEIHRRAPSKQNLVQYSMHWFDWSNPTLRNDFYEFAVDRNNPNHRYNSQLLANWIVVFTGRTPRDFPDDFSVMRNKLNIHVSHLEIGLSAHMLVHGAAVRNLACGFCRCFDYDYKNVPDIMSALDIDSIGNIFLIMGVGHESDNKKETLNLFNNQMVDAASDHGQKWLTEPKPEMSEYIFYHV